MEQKDLTFDFLVGYIPPQLRRENKKKHIAQRSVHWNIAAVSTVFAATCLGMLLLPHPEASETEKRRLAEFPSFSFKTLFSGEFMAGISDYFNDTVPFRENLIGVNSSLSGLFGIKTENSVIFYGQPMNISNSEDHEASVPIVTTPAETVAPSETTPPVSETAPAETEVTTTPAETPPPAETTPGGVVGNDEGIISNGIVVVNKMGIMFYGGGMGIGQSYAGWVNAYAEQLGRDVNVYSMVIPTSVSFYLPEKYKSYTASQKDNIDNITNFLKNVKNVDAYSALEAHKDEQIYTRTDHHWAALGAYYTAKQFAADAGVDFLDISGYDTVSVPGYVGTLYSFTNDPTLKNNPEDFVYYVPKVKDYNVTYYDQKFANPKPGKLFNDGAKGSSLYLTFIGGDSNVVKIDTGTKNGRKLVIFKDSYGNALPCYLTGSFEEIYVCDMRYFERNSIEFIKEQGITDVLFASCAFSATGTNAKNIEKMRTQNASAN